MKVYVAYYEESQEINPEVYASPELAYDRMLCGLEDNFYLLDVWGQKEKGEFVSEQIAKLKESYKTNPKEFGCDICWCVEHTVIGGI